MPGFGSHPFAKGSLNGVLTVSGATGFEDLGFQVSGSGPRFRIWASAAWFEFIEFSLQSPRNPLPAQMLHRQVLTGHWEC